MALIFPIAPRFDNPTITRADCNYIVVQWDFPQAPPDTLFPGSAWVHDGDYDLQLIQLNMFRGGPNYAWSGYIGDLPDSDWIVEAGWIAVLDPLGEVWITNAPYPVTCERVWLPMVER
jgi:hypothetical protein